MASCDNNFDDIESAAKKYFGFSLRPYQKVAIDNILHARDQIVLLPTSYGKSLCFQLPALFLSGVTIITYPLRALVADQARSLKEKGLDCVVLKGGQTNKQRDEIFQKISSGCKIVIATVEVLRGKTLKRLSQFKVSHLAIDEAHCISEWGDTFRPMYLELTKIINILNPTCVSAFTATASKRIIKRINEVAFNARHGLGRGDFNPLESFLFTSGSSKESDFKDNNLTDTSKSDTKNATDLELVRIVRGDVDRPNIFYHVCHAANKTAAVLLLVKLLPRPILVFSSTRDNSERLSMIIQKVIGDVEGDKDFARYYHAGEMTKSARKETEEWFFSRKDGVLCATCAYGMGVDKSNIRSVIHWEATENIEAYLQESGRIGRDGKSAYAFLLYNTEDLHNKKIKREMREYPLIKSCRREYLLSHLDNPPVECSGCDNCTSSEKIKKITNLIKKIENTTIETVKRRNNLYWVPNIEKKLIDNLNDLTRSVLKVNIWNDAAIKKVIQELLLTGRLQNKKTLTNSVLSLCHPIRTGFQEIEARGIKENLFAIFFEARGPLLRLQFSLRALVRRERALAHSFSSFFASAFLHNLQRKSKKEYIKEPQQKSQSHTY